MNAKYEIGQEVVITPVEERVLSPRDSALEPYAGQTGRVTECHWITTSTGQVFYIYTVQVGPDKGKIVLHEDELEAHFS